MPARQTTKSDRELWDLVAFILTLPKMTAAEYDALDRRFALAQGLQQMAPLMVTVVTK